jgi:hypothetical protein
MQGIFHLYILVILCYVASTIGGLYMPTISIVVHRIEQRRIYDGDRPDRPASVFDASGVRYILDDAAVPRFSAPIINDGVKLVQVAKIKYHRDGKRRNFVTHLNGSELPKRRSCLSCGKQLDSEWSGNRICSLCKQTAAWSQGISETGLR